MGKRVVSLFTILMIGLSICIIRLYGLTIQNGTLAQAASNQQKYTLQIRKERGMIYDRKLKPLTEGSTEYLAAVAPSTETAAALSKILPQSKIKSVYQLLTERNPFLLKLDQNISAPGVTVFPLKSRYSSPALATHLIGYVDEGGMGAAGAEKAFDDSLTQNQGELKITYRVDALGHILPSETAEITDTLSQDSSGVALTLDRDIQKITQKAMDRKISKGAAVVLDAENGQLLASVSCPDFNPDDVSSVMNASNSPLLDRTISSYSVGSVFKLVSAAAALENGADPNEEYDCTGKIEVDGQSFACYNGEAHGKVNLQKAISESCNGYFVQLMQKVPQEKFLSMTRSLGFGDSYELLPGIRSSAGTLPSLDTLKIPRALANFSFGQGELTASPIQIAAMTEAIASGGLYRKPVAFLGTVDQGGNLTTNSVQQPNRVMSQETSLILKDAMKLSASEGTSKLGKPDFVEAAAKTATAQTGQYDGDKEKVISWYTGFFPAESPKYVVTIMAEDGDGGGATCGPVFKEIADELYPKN
ncbi:Cell division protein FtsI (Peptidoglycan synthetase) [Ruminococcaceae bacterium BL-4]|nr:Cell division protein FtsI (Peptidoglycan synthetase) [Ruminococcaceae bacterium BL-4]